MDTVNPKNKYKKKLTILKVDTPLLNVILG